MDRQKPNEVDVKTISLLELTIKDIIGVNPNPCGLVASYYWTRKGISTLALHSCTSNKIESIYKHKEVVRASHNNRHKVEALNL